MFLCPWKFLQHRWSPRPQSTFSVPNLLIQNTREAFGLQPHLRRSVHRSELKQSALREGFSCLPKHSNGVQACFCKYQAFRKTGFSGNKWLVHGSRYFSVDDLLDRARLPTASSQASRNFRLSNYSLPKSQEFSLSSGENKVLNLGTRLLWLTNCKTNSEVGSDESINVFCKRNL